MSEGRRKGTMRDDIPSPQPRVAINLLLELSVGAPQRRIAVNLFPELRVGVDFARRGDCVGETPHTYFYVNWKAKAPNIYRNDRICRRFTG